VCSSDLVVRPEMVQIGERDTAAGIGWRGIVRRRFFRGSRHIYMVEAGALHLSVDAPPDQPVAPATEIVLSVDARHTWSVRA